MRTTNARSILITTLLLTVVATAWCAPSSQETTMKKLRSQFRLIDDKQNIFSVSKDYALQPSFDTNGELIRISVVPKYYFENNHAEWREPNSLVSMSAQRYRHLLARIMGIKDLGNLSHRGGVGTMLNLQTSFWDEYKEALVERTTFRKPPRESYSVTKFVVHYVHPVNGEVAAKEMTLVGRRVKIDGKWYWTAASVFRSLTVGSHVSVEAAGPLSEQPTGASKSDTPTGTVR